MGRVELTLAADVDMQIDRLVDDDQFVDRGEAVEELLEMGIREYGPSNDTTRDDLDFAEEMMGPGDSGTGMGSGTGMDEGYGQDDGSRL
ncbi:DUF7120 family protein [Halomicrococcus sp. NG-SE-24]|uniref:DUF7120 family protein n=1 Tax=Halomicrococcus sp. NG-SE-24 TaxID=3436928 RepID=UPI003D9558A3